MCVYMCVYIYIYININTVVVFQSPSRIQLLATPWTTMCQASLTLTISQSLPKFISI